MKNCSSEFKQEVSLLGKQQKLIISYNGIEISNETINSASMFYEGNLLKSMMKSLEIESTEAIAINTELTVQYGLLVNDEYEYIDLGKFYVTEVERQEDTKSYLIKCHDLMIRTMKNYDDIEFDYDWEEPLTVATYLVALASQLGIQWNFTAPLFANANRLIRTDLYKGLRYTVRDIFDEISQVAGGSLCINKDNQLEMRYPTTSSQYTIDGNYLKDINVTFKDKFGPINSVVLSRSAESDNVYLKDEESIEQNGLCEIKIVDNQIMNLNDRADYLPELFDKLAGLNYFINDYSSTGIMFLDYLDKYNVLIDDVLYNCIMLNDEQNITQGLEELVYAEMPEQSETDYDKADKTDQKINQTYLIVDKQNQKIESVITNVNEQNNKISQITQTVDELNSKISDIADITESQESIYAKVQFEKVNQSEPITIRVHPTGVNISYLYPRNNLYPSNNLYMTGRTIRFTNLSEYELTEDVEYTNYRKYYSYDGTTEEYTLLEKGVDYIVGNIISGSVYQNTYIDYELPLNLLYYNQDNYDEFLLDYDSQTCQIRKKVVYNADGTTALSGSETTITLTYPHISLNDGDYIVEVLGYDTAYIFVRLMAQNIYTTQFATKAELNSEIRQTKSEIDLSVNEKLESYSTTQQMNSAINVKANQITSQVSETYETKNNANMNYSSLNQRANSIESTVSQKVGNNEIISKINQSPESVEINANRVSLTGKTINLTSDNIAINSTNFSVDRNGNMNCTNANVSGNITSNNATITGGNIYLTDGGSIDTASLNIYRQDGEGTWETYVMSSGTNFYGNSGTILIDTGKLGPQAGIYVSGLYNDDFTNIMNGSILCKNLRQYSKESFKKNIKLYNGNALDIVKQSEIYTYNFKSEKDDDKKHIGFVIADEGGNYKTPEEVISAEKDGIEQYNMTSILWKAVQEQQEKIELLQKEIGILKEGKNNGEN